MSDAMSRRAARTQLGVVLIAGAAVLWSRAIALDLDRSDPPIHAATIVVATWIVALLAAGLGSLAGRRPGAAWGLAPSLYLPGVGLALVLPLTIHLPVVLLLGGNFDLWCGLSAPITGIAHVALALLVASRACALADGRPTRSPVSIYTIVLAISCVPFVVLWAIPPILVSLTGLPFLPILRAMETIAARDRTEPVELPAAYARA